MADPVAEVCATLAVVLGLLLSGSLFFAWLSSLRCFDVYVTPSSAAKPVTRERVTFSEFRRRILGSQSGTLHGLLLRREAYGETCFTNRGVQALEPGTGVVLEVLRDEWDRALATNQHWRCA